jgi:thiol-disulfide isomerase/thioredoxin
MWVEFLGTALQSNDGSKSTTQYLEDAEYVMIYISAHWCGPCRVMTPLIASAYQNQTGNTRVVFLSLDNNKSQFDEYFESMPWCAVQYDKERHHIVNRISELIRHPITSIPCLLVFDKSGNFVTSDGCRNFENYFTKNARQSGVRDSSQVRSLSVVFNDSHGLG